MNLKLLTVVVHFFLCEFCTESFWELVMENSSVSTLKVHGTVRSN